MLDPFGDDLEGALQINFFQTILQTKGRWTLSPPQRNINLMLIFENKTESITHYYWIGIAVEALRCLASQYMVCIFELIYLIQSANQTCWHQLQWNLMSRVWFVLIAYWLNRMVFLGMFVILSTMFILTNTLQHKRLLLSLFLFTTDHRVCVPRPTQFFAINEKWLLIRSMNWFFSFCVYFLQAA